MASPYSAKLKEALRIVISRDGPLLVSGKIPLTLQVIVPNDEGIPWEWNEARSFVTEPEYRLCRCGESKKNPFCDDRCKETRFDGTETATRESFIGEEKAYNGPTLTLRDSESLCAHARFCMAAGTIWNNVKQSNRSGARELAIREANHCPSGRLALQDSLTLAPIETVLVPSIGIVEDTTRSCSGPLVVRGGIRIESEDGTPYKERNRVALCRCGHSTNKPFCNGSHRQINFKDGLMNF